MRSELEFDLKSTRKLITRRPDPRKTPYKALYNKRVQKFRLLPIAQANVYPKHHECGVRVDQMRRGLLYDAYRTRSACLRWNHARLLGEVAQSDNSEPAVERTKPAELSRKYRPQAP